MDIEVSTHDKMIVDKINDICTVSVKKFEDAVMGEDLLGMMKLHYEELITHIDDLIDELESTEAKAELIFYTADLRIQIDEVFVAVKAVLDHRAEKNAQ